MNTIYLTLSIYISLLTLFTDPSDCANGDLIKSFTVNDGTSVSVAVGDSVNFVCTKQDAVANPTWAIQALKSGQYIAGGASFSITSQSVSVTNPATCNYNGTIECRATSGSTTDSKTVTVNVACGADGTAVTTPKNEVTTIAMKPTLLFSSVISALCILYRMN